MKTAIKLLALVAMFSVGTEVSAQGFLKKLEKAANKTLSATDKVLDGADKALDATDAVLGETTPADSTKKINWEAIPVYHTQKITETDANGQPLLNEDGTPKVRVFLVDQFGNKRSKEAVKAQQKKLWAAVGAIAGKVGIGAVAGGLLKGDVEGAVAGAAAGAVASADDIKMAVAQKKSLNQQKKLLKAYEENFTDEGVPVDAKADLSKIKNLDLAEDNSLSMSSEELKKELESEAFNTTDDSAWDI